MIKQIDNVAWFKLNGLMRHGLVYGAGNVCSFYPLVNEFPKSGGSWFAQLLSDAMGIPFPRNRLPMLRPSLLHGHYSYKSFMTNSAVVWRDGRDVMVSWYYHRVVGNELSSKAASERVAKHLGFSDLQDIETNLPKFMEFSFERPNQPGFSWADFVDQWLEREAFHTSYEKLLANTASEVASALEWFSAPALSAKDLKALVDKYSFEKQSGRKSGTEDSSSYLRNGTSGNWVNKFSPLARQIFDSYGGGQLIALGYEADHTWV